MHGSNREGRSVIAPLDSTKILQVMDEHLQKQDWLEGNRPTIADIACPYIALAADGKIALEDYPHVIAWISRIKQLPGYISMPGL